MDGNRTRLGLIDSEVLYPESYHGINFWCVFLTRLPTFRDDTVANLPAGRDSNYLTFGAPNRN